MARPLPDGRSRAEPTAAVSGSPAGFALGGTLALPPPGCRMPLALPPGLNCALCPPAGPRPPRALLYHCRRGPEPPRSRSSQAHGSLGSSSSPPREPPTEQALQPAAQPNGHHLPRSTQPSLEQALGARLRHMGDQFHREHQLRHRERQQQQQQQQQQGPLWGHFCHFLFQLLGVFYNLPGEGGLGLGPN